VMNHLVKFLPPQWHAPGFFIEEAALGHMPEGVLPFEFSRFSVGEGCRSVAEAHDDSEIWLISEGRGRLRVDDTIIDVSKNMAIYLRPHVTHEIENTGDTPLWIFSIWWTV
jgi:mannose-6-phosphate isomerase-like protein (cupin superfamily)